MRDHQPISVQYYQLVLWMDFNGLQRTFTTVTIRGFWHFYGQRLSAQCVTYIILKPPYSYTSSWQSLMEMTV